MPRPIAAGVFGIARTTAPPIVSCSAAMVVPAMIDTTSVDGADQRFQCGPGLAERLRLHRDHKRVDGAGVLRIEPDAFRARVR